MEHACRGNASPDRSSSRRVAEQHAKQPLGSSLMSRLSDRLRLRSPGTGEGPPDPTAGSGQAVSLLPERSRLTRRVCQTPAGMAASCLPTSSMLLPPVSSCCRGEGAADSLSAACSWSCRAHMHTTYIRLEICNMHSPEDGMPGFQ